jgi:hypothetical protein
MKHPLIRPSIYLVSVLTLMITFSVFYQDNHEVLGSLAAAVMATVLVFGSLVMLNWLAQVFMK